jgi:hypothetical protein
LPAAVFNVVQMSSSYIGPHIAIDRMIWSDSSVGTV